jgi:DNA polymerase-3 subunit gamma/tau
MDVIELDAATHTGVDTIREAIVEHVRFAPTFGKAKVYILDEAHMLSSSSWNALLKTLEEPPAYAYFILATTEWHKIPATIISRCQRFEFKRIADDVLAARVCELATREGWAVDEEVVRLIVSRADGCVRDAETLLGQLGSLGESRIDAALAGLVIPPTHLPLAAGLMQRWVKRDLAGALTEARRLADEGVALLPLFDDLLLIVRQLLQASALPERAKAWANGTAEERAMAPLVGSFSALHLHDFALTLMERRKDVKGGVDPLFALELVSTLVVCGMLERGNAPVAMSAPQPPPEVKRGTVVAVSPAPAPVPQITPDAPQPSASAPVVLQEVVPQVISSPEPVPSVPLPSVAPAVSEAGSGELDLSTIRMKWSAIIRAIDEKNRSLPFILKISQPHEVQGSVLVVRFQYPFHKDKIVADVKNRRIVEECARAVLGVSSLTIEGIVGEDAARTEERSQDMVTNILKAFGGQVVEG